MGLLAAALRNLNRVFAGRGRVLVAAANHVYDRSELAEYYTADQHSGCGGLYDDHCHGHGRFRPERRGDGKPGGDRGGGVVPGGAASDRGRSGGVGGWDAGRVVQRRDGVVHWHFAVYRPVWHDYHFLRGGLERQWWQD